ncbi:hypothetical protein [Sphingopyxis sp. QXT-31]|uniref:hypothetical protein n=1 Tax=Sphingopyxis sp. QXT-31 TaxID=1357916 RepID=UPI001E5A6CA8|nr:hypothetical protein [Sphingopyxis sp. QXT-31]
MQIAHARFDGINFGYWYVEVRKKGKPARQLLWEARDRWFIIRTLQSDGSWADDEEIRESDSVALDDLIKRLSDYHNANPLSQ